jgi:hypothetical protein
MDDEQQIVRSRKNAVRTAWLMTAVAATIFVLFILSGVLGH